MTIRRVQSYIPGVEGSSVHEREEHLTLALSDMKLAMEGELQLPTEESPGNVDGKVVSVLFEKAGVDTPIEHDLRRTARHWFPVGSNTYARFKDGERAPSTGTLYLQADTAPTRARILVF